jgi:hypothetical protein
MHQRVTAESFGPGGQLFELVLGGGCFASRVVSEVDLKGGSENNNNGQHRPKLCVLLLWWPVVVSLWSQFHSQQ